MSIRLFHLVLLAYPRAFRDRHREELVTFFARQLEDARRSGSWTAVAALWLNTVADVARTTWRLRFGRSRHRASLVAVQETPLRRLAIGSIGEAFRSAARSWRSLVASAATLALGVAATTAVYSLVDGVLLRRLPYPDANRLVSIGMRIGEGTYRFGPASTGHLRELRDHLPGLERVVASSNTSLTLTGEAEPRTINGLSVTDGFFELFGGVPIRGRTFGPADAAPGAPPVLVLSEAGWHEELGGAPDVIGRVLTLNGTAYTVVGVVSDDFAAPQQLGRTQARAYVPLPLERNEQAYGQFYLQATGKLAEGRTIESVAVDMDGLMARVTAAKHPEFDVTGSLHPLREIVLGESIERTLLLALAGVVVLLLISCANVAHLLLMRGFDRHRELAVRQALGASRGRLIAQLVGEGAIVGLAGGLAGAVLAHIGVRLFVAFGPGGIPRLGTVAVDLRVLAVCLALAVAAAILSAWLPAHVATRQDPIRALREGGRANTAGRTRRRLQVALAMASVACATVLVLCAGLFGRSFGQLASVDPGFTPDGLATVKVRLRSGGDAEWRVFYEQLREQTMAIPGVTSVAMTSGMPFTGDGVGSRLWPETWREGDPDPAFTTLDYVGGSWFDTVGIPLVEGRLFRAGDVVGSPRVAIVDEPWVKAFMPDSARVIGATVRSGRPDDDDSSEMTIVGIVKGTRGQLWSEPSPTVYVPMAQEAWRAISVVARTSGDPAAVLPAMRQAVWHLDPDLPVDRSDVMTSLGAASIASERFYAALVAVFAVVGLLLAVAGVYSAVSNAVRQMSRDIGVRLALGAEPSRMRALVVRTGVWPAVAGIALGLAAVMAGGQLIAAHLFGVTPWDPMTLTGVPMLLFGVAVAACLGPAIRAGRTDPASILTEH